MEMQRTILVDIEEFKLLNDEMIRYDETRETVIKKSRDINKNSKQSIYCLHRKDFIKAKSHLCTATKIIIELTEKLNKESTLRSGGFSSALEEFVEAHCLLHFLETGRLVTCKDLLYVNREEYIGGVIDFTGEIVRYAVKQATDRNIIEVTKCKDIVEDISEQLIQFDFRNTPLRRKYDSLKYNFRKLENMLYELSLVGKIPFRSDLEVFVDKSDHAKNETFPENS